MQSEMATFRAAIRDNDVEKVATLLGFPVEPILVEGPALRAWGLTEEALQGLRLTVLSAPDGMRLLHLDGDVPWSVVRRIASRVEAAAPESCLMWWWTSASEWTALVVSRDHRGRRIQRLALERDDPDEVGVLKWLAISPQRRAGAEPVAAESFRSHFQEVLDQDGVTRRFFQRFAELLDRLKAEMIAGPDDPEERHDVALVTLLRVVFLYFLQARGALDGDRRYVRRRLESARADSFYRTVLRPLFFGALNRPTGARDEAAGALGELPFLNGGLFEPSPVELRHPELDWPDEIFADLIRGFLERHRFAVEWSGEEELSHAVDPEMLGKVFEGLMYGDRRQRSGSFYTPRHVVAAMVVDILAAWLAEKSGLPEEVVTSLMSGDEDEVALSGGEIRSLRKALKELTILDPAVGTGAFLLEALRRLKEIEEHLDRAAGITRTPGQRYERLCRLVHDHLFGVDIQPTAVRLCELRVWLAMLASLPELPARAMPPLPNLSHRFCVGNSLLDTLDWTRLRVGDRGGLAMVPPDPQSDRLTAELAELQEAYVGAHGAEKAELRRALREAEQAMQADLIRRRLDHLRRGAEPLQRLSESRELFDDESQIKPGQREELDRILQEMDALQGAAKDLEEGRREAAAFSFDGRFAPVMAAGGFAVILTNPPWVRSGAIDGATRRLYGARYRCDDHRLWPGAAELGIRATFGNQTDLSILFLERSLELLQPRGRLCALVPVKLFRSLHGSALRGMLTDHHLEALEDFSESHDSLFDAATYPSMLRVKKAEQARASSARSPEQPELQVRVWRGQDRRCFQVTPRDLAVWGEDPREPWVLVPPEIQEIFAAMRRASRPLGALDLPIRRGVMTGCNRAFLISEEEALRFSPDLRERFLRPVLQGRDIGHKSASGHSGQRLIWPVGEDGEILAELPGELQDHFEAHRQSLEGRADFRGGPIWEIFRRHAEIEEPGVAWPDLGQELTATVVDGPTICMNTVYFIPTKTAELAQGLVHLFHSEPFRAMAWALGERARGEWRRHFAWVLRLMPVPRRWSRWRAGDDPVPSPGDCAAMFGLDEAALGRLRRWRLGDEQPLREVA